MLCGLHSFENNYKKQLCFSLFFLGGGGEILLQSVSITTWHFEDQTTINTYTYLNDLACSATKITLNFPFRSQLATNGKNLVARLQILVACVVSTLSYIMYSSESWNTYSTLKQNLAPSVPYVPLQDP